MLFLLILQERPHLARLLTFAITGVQKQSEAPLLHVRVDGVVYARHGHELMG